MDIKTIVDQVKSLDAKALAVVHTAVTGIVPITVKIKADIGLYSAVAGVALVVGAALGHWVL